MRLSLRTALCAALLAASLGGVASAEPITYTFSGDGNGTVGGTAWSGDFTFTFTGDTTNITSGGGEYFNENLAGLFDGGAFTLALAATTDVVVNTDPANPRAGFFNSLFDNGGTIQNDAFTTYDLATAIGPITETGADLLPTLNSAGDGFETTTGTVVEILGITSLTFTASLAAVPEPASLALFGTALVGLGLIRRRRKS